MKGFSEHWCKVVDVHTSYSVPMHIRKKNYSRAFSSIMIIPNYYYSYKSKVIVLTGSACQMICLYSVLFMKHCQVVYRFRRLLRSNIIVLFFYCTKSSDLEILFAWIFHYNDVVKVTFLFRKNLFKRPFIKFRTPLFAFMCLELDILCIIRIRKNIHGTVRSDKRKNTLK